MTIDISIIYATARPDYPMLGEEMKDVHQFKPFLDSLVGQTFKNFEVIIVDGTRKERNFDFSEYRKHFHIKHVYMKDAPKRVRWAYDKGLWSLQGSFNLGTMYADGRLLLSFGDCGFLPKDNILSLYWNWYQKGYFPQALVVYYKGNKPLFVSEIINNGHGDTGRSVETTKKLVEMGYLKDILRDSRWKFVEDEEIKAGDGTGIYYCPGEHFYGYGSSSLESMLKINGYDCNFDGERALTDVEAGIRLEKLGYKMVCDKNLWLVERAHASIPKDTLFGMPKLCYRSNYSLLILNKQKNKTTANDSKLTGMELEQIVKHGTKWNVPRPVPGTYEYELLMYWFNNPPIFNLTELRNERLRKEGQKIYGYNSGCRNIYKIGE